MSQINMRPGVGIAVFIWKDGKFIMGKRKGAHGDGTWSIPGGHVEFGETLEEAVEREAMEETGMHIQNIRHLAITSDFFKKENKHYITIWFEADWLEGDPTETEPDYFMEFEWHTFQDLPSNLFEPCFANLKKVIPQRFA